jgi:predicted alpha/beta superfamily hydrolase
MKRIYVSFIACLNIVLMPVHLHSQSSLNKITEISIGTYQKVHSKLLNEDRTILISLPEDYNRSTGKYPVLYKLDGDKGVFLQTISAVYYLVDMTDKIPDHIIVGIMNTDRARDMDPEKGADNFIRFFKEELIPFIDKNYRTNGFRILGGQSASSLFAFYSFLQQPALFNGYIFSSFGFYKESLTAQFENELPNIQKINDIGNRYLFVTNGKMDSYDPDGSITERGMSFLKTLQSTVPKSVFIESKVYPEEGHVPFPSVYDGLIWIYSHEKTKNN